MTPRSSSRVPQWDPLPQRQNPTCTGQALCEPMLVSSPEHPKRWGQVSEAY